ASAGAVGGANHHDAAVLAGLSADSRSRGRSKVGGLPEHDAGGAAPVAADQCRDRTTGPTIPGSTRVALITSIPVGASLLASRLPHWVRGVFKMTHKQKRPTLAGRAFS